MFSKIVVTLNDLPESQHAINLARSCKADLPTVLSWGFRGREAYGMNKQLLIGRVRRSV
jgi:hypothetical protein